MSKLPEGRSPLPDEWFVDRANRMENNMTKKYALMIDVDGDWMYVPENPTQFHNFPEPRLFDTIEEARAEQDNWLTAVVVDYTTKQIKPMTEEERKASIKRQERNS